MWSRTRQLDSRRLHAEGREGSSGCLCHFALTTITRIHLLTHTTLHPSPITHPNPLNFIMPVRALLSPPHLILILSSSLISSLPINSATSQTSLSFVHPPPFLVSCRPPPVATTAIFWPILCPTCPCPSRPRSADQVQHRCRSRRSPPPGPGRACSGRRHVC